MILLKDNIVKDIIRFLEHCESKAIIIIFINFNNNYNPS